MSIDNGRFLGRIREALGGKSEIPLPINKVLLLDLDGTLIDSNYQLTDSRIQSSIKRLQNKGWQIGLNSDTPLEALQLWKRRLGINGPLIAERGAIVETGGKVLVDKTAIDVFTESRETIGKHLEDEGIQVWRGNPVEAIRDGLIFEPNQVVVLLNALRQCSLGIFVRVTDSLGNLRTDSITTSRVLAELQDFYPDSDDLEQYINIEHGLAVISRKNIAKRTGALVLINDQQWQQIAMIGDLMNDYIGDDIALHYAVANATPEFQANASYVAKRSLTSGVVEILLRLEKATK